MAMSIALEREKAIVDLLDQVREIERREGVSRASLEHMKDKLIALSRAGHLFPETHFPAPGPSEEATLYSLSVDPDQRFALYIYRPAPGKETAPHNHTTWAIVVGIDGEEPTRVYERVSEDRAAGRATLRQTAAFTIGAHTGATYMPNDVHSIHIAGERPIMHLHLYGRSLLDLPERVNFDLANGTFARAVGKPEVLAPVST